MYGQMTAGSWIYIGTQGILQGTYETFAAVADKRFGGTPAGHADRHRRVRRHGWRAAAGGDAQRRGVPGRRRRGVAAAAAGGDAVPRRAGRLAGRRRRAVPAGEGGGRGRVGRAGRQLRRRAARAAAPRGRGRRRHRPDLGARPAGLPARRRRPRRLGRLRPHQARGVHRPGAGVDGPPRRGDGRVPRRRCRGVRLRQLDPRRGPPGRLRPGVRLPRLRARLHPAAVLRREGAVPVGGAVRATRRTSRRRTRPCSSCSPTTTSCSAGSARRGRRWRSRGCRRGSAGWGTASGTGPGCGSTSSSRRAR